MAARYSALLGEPLLEEQARQDAADEKSRMEFIAVAAVFCAGIVVGVLLVFFAAAVSL